jgi:hypothetical protein
MQLVVSIWPIDASFEVGEEERLGGRRWQNVDGVLAYELDWFWIGTHD